MPTNCRTDPLAPLRSLSAPELLALDRPAARPILAPLLTNRTLALLHGPRGIGKTFLALGLARAAAAGESFLGWRGGGAAVPRRLCRGREHGGRSARGWPCSNFQMASQGEA